MYQGEEVVIYNLYGEFEEIATLTSNVLEERGHPTSRTTTPDPNSLKLYLIFGANVWEDAVLFPPRYIIFQLEQSPIRKWFIPSYFARLQNALQVWDYNLQNIDYLRERGIDAIHVPLGYCPLFASPIYPPETIDILFLGQLRNNHREATITALREAGFTVVANNKTFGEQKKQVVAQAKIVLNLHYGHQAILEEPRIIPLLTAGKVVISETVDDPRYIQLYQDSVIFVQDTNDLIAQCHKWLNVGTMARREWGLKVSRWVMTQRKAIDLWPWQVLELERPPEVPYYDFLVNAPDTCGMAFTPRTAHLLFTGWKAVKHYGERTLMQRTY
jgi:hypothetical protein